MNSDMVNALELVMIIVYSLARFSASVAIVWLVVQSNISTGWQVFLIALVILGGLGTDLHYHNPNEKHQQATQEQTESKHEALD